MADHHFLCGQIRALESKLLTPETVDRMINASSLEDAFKGLLELQYSDYIEEGTTPENFSTIIDQGLLETKELIINETQDTPVLTFLWGEFDLNNIKRALKEKLIENKDSLSEFTEDNGYSRLGTLDQETLQSLVWENQVPEETSLKFLCEATLSASEVFKNNEWYIVENQLDQAFFDDLGRIATASRDPFFLALYEKNLIQAQEQILGRVVIIEKRKVTSSEWIHAKTGIAYDSIKDIDSAESLTKVIPALKSSKNADLTELAPIIESWEKNQNNSAKDFIHDAAIGASNHLSVPFGYFKKREDNAHLLRFILYAKSSGLSPDDIRKSLEATL